MRRILILLTAIALTIGGTVAAAPANAATCTTIWLATPSYEHKIDTGRWRCENLRDRTADGRFVALHYRDGRFLDWQDDWAYTRMRPHGGRVKSTADSIRALAARYDVNLQFADRDMRGRMGCYGGFANSVSGTYQGSPRYPGEGLIRIGTGTTTRCMNDRATALNVAKHEISHALIERICGTTDPPRVGDRSEEVTSAYAMRYLGAGMNAGGYKPNRSDMWQAGKIHGGWCG
jgi:hypothetical protein